MPRTVKRLYQGSQSTTTTNRVTSPALTTTQITEIYLANTGTAERTVTIFQGGTATSNTIMAGVTVPAGGTTLLQDLKIVLAPAQTLAAKQDTGTDIIMTVYGIEEV